MPPPISRMPSVEDFVSLAQNYSANKSLRLRDNNTVGTPWFYNNQARNERTMRAFVTALREKFGDDVGARLETKLQAAAQRTGGYLKAGMVRDALTEAKSALETQNMLTKFLTNARANSATGYHETRFTTELDKALTGIGLFSPRERAALHKLMFDDVSNHFTNKIRAGENFTPDDMVHYLQSSQLMVAAAHIKSEGSLDKLPTSFANKIAFRQKFEGVESLGYIARNVGPNFITNGQLNREAIWKAVSNDGMPPDLSEDDFIINVNSEAMTSLARRLPDMPLQALRDFMKLTMSMPVDTVVDIALTGRAVTLADMDSICPGFQVAYPSLTVAEDRIARDFSRITEQATLANGESVRFTPQLSFTGGDTFRLGASTNYAFDSPQDAALYKAHFPNSMTRSVVRNALEICQDNTNQARQVLSFCGQKSLTMLMKALPLLPDAVNVVFNEHMSTQNTITRAADGKINMSITTPQDPRIVQVLGSLSMNIEIDANGSYRLTSLLAQPRAKAVAGA